MRTGGGSRAFYPEVSKVEFDRADHALAHVTVGYSGGVVELEKNGGVWIAKRMVSVWIS